MAGEKGWEIEKIPYGKAEIKVKIPKANYLTTLALQNRLGFKNEVKEIKRALANPIGTKTLKEIAKGKKNAVVVVNDITRPTPTYKLLPHLLEELKVAGIREDKITLLVATGTHRDNTKEELEGMLGKGILERFKVLNHHCQDEKKMVYLGKTKNTIPVVINRLFVEAEVKVLTATIFPHQTAGFSGGRKSVLPGLASLTTLRQHHGIHYRSFGPAMGWLKGNNFHENALEAAKMAKVDFILNVVQNRHKEIIHVVAGDMEKAWFEGVKWSREIYEVKVPHPVDIVITSPGGFPKDFNLYQSQKSMAAAEIVVKDGGTVILPAECKDGIGARGFYEWMSAASSPKDVIERFFNEGFSIGTSKAYLFSRCLTKADLILVTKNIDDITLKKMFIKRADTVEKAIEMALAKHGDTAEIILIKNGSDMIPHMEKGRER